MTIASLAPAVAEAIEEIRADFPDALVTFAPDGQGGACVIVEPLSLASPRFQLQTWVGFRITYVHPNADIYPHYVRSDLVANGTALAPPLHPNHQFEGRAAVMVSRSNRRHSPVTDTASLKLHKVIEWLNEQR